MGMLQINPGIFVSSVPAVLAERPRRQQPPDGPGPRDEGRRAQGGAHQPQDGELRHARGPSGEEHGARKFPDN